MNGQLHQDASGADPPAWTEGGQDAPLSTRNCIYVLMALAPPDGTTMYVDQITAEAPPEVSITYRTWKAAFGRRFDILHIHWPEYLIRAQNPAVAVIRGLLFLSLLTRCKLSKAAIVRTVHNMNPHDGQERRWQLWLLDLADRQTSLFIRINATTQVETAAPVVTILHGHYRGRFKGLELSMPTQKRLLYFGLIRGYKGLDRLLTVFTAMDDPYLSLRIVGKPLDADTVASIEKSLSVDRRISARLAFVSDRDLVAEVTCSQVVVLPYREMHNSGAVLVALSLDRPVVVPYTRANESLSREVGAGWMFMYEGALSPAAINRAIVTSARNTRPPDLTNRDWSGIGESHYRAYLQAMAVVRRRRHR